jgi:hypothetical protein
MRVGRVMSGQDQGDACGTELNKKLLQTIGKEQPVKNTKATNGLTQRNQ